MTGARATLEADWLGACRRATEQVAAMLAERPSTRDRIEEVGLGEGGDHTLVIDSAAEDAIFAELDALHADGARFTAISEERGQVDYGDGSIRVIIDPIDGSMNAKRGLSHHAVSIAVADGTTMADVRFAYVYDLGTREEWRAVQGGGAFLDERRLGAGDEDPEERRGRGNRLELVGIESADPRWVADAVGLLEERAHRLRAIGSIALTLCQVAAARLDGMVSLRRCRAVDAAAAQLIVREAGGVVAFSAYDDPLGAPLDLEPRSPVVAARTRAGLDELLPVARRSLAR
jgi:myo-inositol-1(or 4)-monophosphatase